MNKTKIDRYKRFVADIQEGLKTSVEFFAPEKKVEREVWDITEFLQNLNIDFGDDEVLPAVDDPPDIYFRDARFETKEILDPGRERHKEYKDALVKALSVSDPSGLVKHYTPRDLNPTDVGHLVLQEITELTNRYEPKLRKTLDLLFYVNLKHHHLKNGQMPDGALFRAYGWRSVSALIGWGALIFYAGSDAPGFLRERAGTLTERKFE
jgi:hypothetical protein